jgi:hypothetical protein
MRARVGRAAGETGTCNDVVARSEGRDFIPGPVVDKHRNTRLRLDWRIPASEIRGYEAPETE